MSGHARRPPTITVGCYAIVAAFHLLSSGIITLIARSRTIVGRQVPAGVVFETTGGISRLGTGAARHGGMHLRFVAAQTTLLVSEAVVGEKAKDVGTMRIRKEINIGMRRQKKNFISQ